MPQATNGNQIVSSSQVGTGVITSTGILDATIVDADVSASAAIAGSKLQALSVGVNAGVIPSTGITNAHLSGAAGITDANLAQIVTAGKVSGAALTLLTSIPAGAGLIPAANVPAKPSTNMLISRDLSVAGAAVTTAHGLGYTPTYVRAFALVYYGTAGKTIVCIGTFDGTNMKSIYSGDQDGAATIGDTGNFLKLWGPVGANTYQSATIAVDATNITLTWTKNGSPTGIAQIILEAK